MTHADTFRAALGHLPLIAILRGLTPAEAPSVGDAIVESGFRLLEVPLNSPQPLESIALMRERFPGAMVGAGTVLTAQQVRDVHAAGATGFGIGSAIYKPAKTADAVREDALKFVAAWTGSVRA
jgi:2-dehydro-3-deoxyphosphogalactonate aldolase